MSKRGQTANRGSKGDDLSRDIPHDYRRYVGQWLRDLRVQSNLRQQDVADVLGLGFTAVSAMETGRTSVPPEQYEAMANVLGVDHVEFGKTMLRYSNPWAYKMIFGADRKLTDELSELPGRKIQAPGPRN